LSAATTFDPIKPAPPVTTIIPFPALAVGDRSFAPLPLPAQLGSINEFKFIYFQNRSAPAPIADLA
jgi:hypothetical protein